MTNKAPLVAQLLVVGTFALAVVSATHRQNIDRLREQYIQKNGEIDVPQAFYFDMLDVEVLAPVNLAWVSLQLGSAFVFCFNLRRMDWLLGLAFWTLWLLALGVMFLA